MPKSLYRKALAGHVDQVKIKKLGASVAAGALLTLGLAITPALKASADTPTSEASATCSELDVALDKFQAEQPAADAVYHDWTETVVDAPAVPAVPAVYQEVTVVDRAAVPAVTKTVYKRYSWSGGQDVPGSYSTPVSDPSNWHPDNKQNYDGSPVGQIILQGNGNGSYFYWTSAQQIITPAQPEVSHIEYQMVTAAIPAIPAVTHEVQHHDLVSAAVPAKSNHITVTIDGHTSEDTDFGTSFLQSYAFGNQYVSHDWTVTATAWDDANHDVSTSGTSTACEAPVVVPPTSDPTPTTDPTPTPVPTPTPTPTPTTDPTPTPTPTTDPTPTPTPTTVPKPTPAQTLSTLTTPPGGEVTVTDSGFLPGESVQIWLHSSPVLLTTVVADAHGALSVLVSIPNSAVPGAHDIESRGAESGSVFTGVTVTSLLAPAAQSASLAYTGSDIGAWPWVAVLVLLTGGVLLWFARRRRTDES